MQPKVQYTEFQKIFGSEISGSEKYRKTGKVLTIFSYFFQIYRNWM